MAYIGRDLRTGAFRQLDDISSGFDGSDTTHTMQVNSTNVSVGDVNQILLSLGGVIQKPGTDFTVSGSTLTFTTAPAANTSFFAILLGSDNGGTVTPTDGSVTGDKVASTGAFTIGAAGTTSSIAGANILVEANSLFIGDDVSSTTDTAANSVAVGIDALDAVTTGDANVAIGKSALSGNTTGGNNVAIGNQALNAPDTESNNIAIGSNALNASISGGEYNVAIGSSAGAALTSGDYNTFVGYNAGAGNTSGQRAVVIGGEAMDSAATTSTGNIVIGWQAGRAITSGEYNLIAGYTSGAAITTGSANVALGQGCLTQPDTESNNIAIGMDTMNAAIAGGEYNIAVGRNTLDALTSGDAHVAIGYQAGGAVTTGYESVYIGMKAGGSEANSIGTDPISGYRNIIIGPYMNTNANDTNHSIALGYAFNVVSNRFAFGKPSNVVYNDFTSNNSWTRSSDERLKENIKDVEYNGLDFINELRPVTFNWKASQDVPKDMEEYDAEENHMDTEFVHDGVIAQEVKAAMDKVGYSSFNGWSVQNTGTQSVSSEMFVFPLIKAVQELSAEIKKLKEEK